MVDGGGELGGVELDPGLWEDAFLLEVEEELAAGAKVRDHVQFFGGLERVLQRHDEGVRD